MPLKLFLPLLVFASIAVAEDKPMSAPPPQGQQTGSGQGERIDVDKIRRNYWNRSEENDTRVVQNRLYSKAHKFEIGVFGGTITGDPFVTMKTAGGTLGYHFTEAFGVFGTYWKVFANKSSAEDFLEQSTNVKANGNDPADYKGLEFTWSPIYGKLSLLGEMIVHYDFHLMLGGGMTGHELGNAFTITAGAGQQFYLSRSMSLRIDYRLTRYDEPVRGRNDTQPTFGQIVLNRTSYNDVITVGFDFLL